MVNGIACNVLDWIADYFKIPHDVIRNIIVEYNGTIFTIKYDVGSIDTNRFKTEEDGWRAIEAIKTASVAYRLLK